MLNNRIEHGIYFRFSWQILNKKWTWSPPYKQFILIMYHQLENFPTFLASDFFICILMNLFIFLQLANYFIWMGPVQVMQMKDIEYRLTNLKNYKTKIDINLPIISSIHLLICWSCLPQTIIILTISCQGLISSKPCFNSSSRRCSVFKMKVMLAI